MELTTLMLILGAVVTVKMVTGVSRGKKWCRPPQSFPRGCRSCSATNPGFAHFCRQCGARL